ncbi:DUF6074 family protein [Pseudorhizobium flavum]|uniref:DUF6074 family protein n=1 Tax=Pseudorhizobium flavum TaxID=1335061 RepID=UPI0024924E37|nr:DUF6074 family protein [Pseudorhizobium flavum]
MTLLQFPSHRRAADIRRCAATLRDLHGEKANQFWCNEMALLVSALREVGACEAEISHQAQMFMNAVQLELQAGFANESIG